MNDDDIVEVERGEWARISGPRGAPADPSPALDGVAPADMEEIYRPLARLLAGLVARDDRGPGAFVVAITGSVAAGKSQTAEVLAHLLSATGVGVVAVVSTDSFLYPNAVLEARGQAMRKGFPETYDHQALIGFLGDQRSGRPSVVPEYSHRTYDIEPETGRTVGGCRVVIIEGLHLLDLPAPGAELASVVDFSIYLDAAHDDLEAWFSRRFVALCRAGADDQGSFYHRFGALADDQLAATAAAVWEHINAPNLLANIEPGREQADLVVVKGADHRVVAVRVRRRWLLAAGEPGEASSERAPGRDGAGAAG